MSDTVKNLFLAELKKSLGDEESYKGKDVKVVVRIDNINVMTFHLSKDEEVNVINGPEKKWD